MLIPLTSRQPPFECHRSCGHIIRPGDTTYITQGTLICSDCAYPPEREWTFAWTTDGHENYGIICHTKEEAIAESEPYMAIMSRPTGTDRWQKEPR